MTSTHLLRELDGRRRMRSCVICLRLEPTPGSTGRAKLAVRITTETSDRPFEIEMYPAAVMLLTTGGIFARRKTDRRYNMTRSMFKLGLPLTLALAVASAAAVAQTKDQTPEITIQGNPAVTKTVERAYSGDPTDRYTFREAVSYANLDLSTASGAAELAKRVRETATKGCEELQQAADPMSLLDDDSECVRGATAGAMLQVKAAIAAAKSDVASKTNT
jgi:UrcA family protein